MFPDSHRHPSKGIHRPLTSFSSGDPVSHRWQPVLTLLAIFKINLNDTTLFMFFSGEPVPAGHCNAEKANG